MEASEELLAELFCEVDQDRRVVVDLEVFLAAVDRQLSSDALRGVCNVATLLYSLL